MCSKVANQNLDFRIVDNYDGRLCIKIDSLEIELLEKSDNWFS